jgi:hypothetical protein
MPSLDFGTRFSRDICLYRLSGFRGPAQRKLPLAKRGNCPLIANKIFVSRGATDLRGTTSETKQHRGPEQSASCRRSAAALTMRSVTHYFRQCVANRPFGFAALEGSQYESQKANALPLASLRRLPVARQRRYEALRQGLDARRERRRGARVQRELPGSWRTA